MAGLFRPFSYPNQVPDGGPTTPTGHSRLVWANPRSLAATKGISVDFSSCGYLDVSLPRVRPDGLWIQPPVTGYDPRRVSPFGNLRIKGCLRLPEAYRSLPRPSSLPGAKASALRPFMLDFYFPFPAKEPPARCEGQRRRHLRSLSGPQESFTEAPPAEVDCPSASRFRRPHRLRPSRLRPGRFTSYVACQGSVGGSANPPSVRSYAAPQGPPHRLLPLCARLAPNQWDNSEAYRWRGWDVNENRAACC